MCTPRNLVLLTLSTVAPLMVRGACRECTLLKSTTISFVFSTFRREIVVTAPPGQAAHLAPVVVSSLLLMRPTTVVSSANLMKRLELFDGVQSWVSRVKRRGLSTHPWGAPVFSVMVLDVLLRPVLPEVSRSESPTARCTATY